MEPTEIIPAVDAERAAALAGDAVSSRPLAPAAEQSLARAIARLPEAMALSDAEAQAAPR